MTRSHVPRRANFELPSLRFASESVAGGKIDARPPRPRLASPIWKSRNPAGWPAKAAQKNVSESPISPNLTQFDPVSPRLDTPKLAREARRGKARRASRFQPPCVTWGKGRPSKGRGWRDACVKSGGSCVRCGAVRCSAVRCVGRQLQLIRRLGVAAAMAKSKAASSSSIPTKASRAPASGCSPTPQHQRPLYSLCFCVTAATDADCSTAAHPIASFHSTAAGIVCTSTASYGCCARAASTRLHLRLAPRPFATKRSRIPPSRLSPYHHIPSSIDSSSQNVLEARQE